MVTICWRRARSMEGGWVFFFFIVMFSSRAHFHAWLTESFGRLPGMGCFLVGYVAGLHSLSFVPWRY